MTALRRLLDVAVIVLAGLLAPAGAEGSVDAGSPDSGSLHGDPVALYGAQGCVASGGGALPGAALAGLALLRRRKKR